MATSGKEVRACKADVRPAPSGAKVTFARSVKSGPHGRSRSD
jgi:hypothetical protein